MSADPVHQEVPNLIAPKGDFVSSVQAASEFGYSNDHIARICRLGEVLCERDGKVWKVSRVSLEEYISATLKAEEERRRAQSERFRKELNGDAPSRTVFVPRVAAPSPYETVTRTVATHAAIFFLAFAISAPLAQVFHPTTPSRVVGVFSFVVPSVEQRGAVLGAQTDQLALSFQPSSWISALSDLLWSEPQVYVPPPVILREVVPATSQASVSTPTTLIQNITQPLTISGVSTDLLTTRLQELENELRNEIYLYSARAERGISGNYRAIGLTNVINNLDGVTIRNATIIGGSISGTSGIGGGGASDLDDLSDVTIASPALGQVLLYDGSTWNNVATSSLGITGGGSSFGQAFELTNGALAPTTTVGVIISASSTIQSLSTTNATSTNATTTNLFTSNLTVGSLSGLLKATSGVVSAATAGVDYLTDAFRSWTLSTNTFGQSALAPTTTQNLLINGTGTSTFAGGLEAWRQIAAPYFTATSTTATSTFGAGIQTTYLNVTGTAATSTFARGIDLAGGCFAINGTCVGGGSGSPGGSDGQLQYNNGGAFGGAASVYYDDINNLLGIGTTSPFAKLAVNPVAGDTNQFVVGSSTATSFIINSAGNVGVGTSNPSNRLDVDVGNASGSGLRVSGSLIPAIIFESTESPNTSSYRFQIRGGTTRQFKIVDNTNSLDRLVFNEGAGTQNVYFPNSNVGIGTTTPDSILSLLSADPILLIKDTETGTANTNVTLRFAESGVSGVTDNYVDFNLGSNGLFSFIDNYTAGGGTGTRFVVSDAGNFGIGTTSPARTLDVRTTSSVGTSFGLSNLDTGGSEFILFSTGSGNTGGAGNLGVFRPTTPGGGSGNFQLYLQGSSGNFGIATTTPWRKLSVVDTVAAAQLALAYDTTRYATFQVTSVGDLVIDAQGDDVSLLDDNLYVCTGGSCPAGPSGTGNLVVEGQLVLPNGTAPTVSAVGSIAVDTTDNQLLIATSTNASFPVVIPLEQPLFSLTVGSTTPEFISSGTIPISRWVSEGREITRFGCFVTGGTSKVVNVTDGTNDTETITCATTHTADTSVDTNSTFTAGELWYIEFGATSGAVNYVTFTAYGHITRE